MSAGGTARVTMLARNNFTHDSRIEKEARTLVAAGYGVTVMAEARGDLPLAETRDGYSVQRIERPRVRTRGLRMLAYLRRLEDALVESEPQIVHAHDTDALQPAARAAQRLGVPFVHDAHELWLGQQNRGRSAAYFAAYLAYYAGIELRYLYRAAAHVAATASVARHLARRYRLRSVRPLLNYPEVAGPPAPREIRTLPGGSAIPAEAPIVLHVGAVLVGRGIEATIDAMRDVPEAHLVLLGFGDRGLVERAAAAGQQGLESRVHFLGPVPPGEVVAYAASATLAVIPVPPSCLSHRYSLPNKLFESMAAGLPVIGNVDLPEVRRVIAESGGGLAVDTQQPRLLGAAMRRLLDHPDEAAAMGREGRRAVEQRYNWSASAAVLLEVYDEVRRSSASRAAARSSSRTTRRTSSSGR